MFERTFCALHPDHNIKIFTGMSFLNNKYCRLLFIIITNYGTFIVYLQRTLE